MLDELNNYAGIKVLLFFLENPSREIHIKELSRTLKISPSTSKRFCDFFSNKKILLSEKKSNSIFLKLDNDLQYVKELKRFYAIDTLLNKFTLKEKGIFNVAIYGSYASGEYLKNSDVDLLIISRNKDFSKNFISKFQDKIKKEINVTTFTLAEWTKLKEDNDPFYNEIIKKHFILYGDELE